MLTVGRTDNEWCDIKKQSNFDSSNRKETLDYFEFQLRRFSVFELNQRFGTELSVRVLVVFPFSRSK